jgi:hypothetical protein
MTSHRNYKVTKAEFDDILRKSDPASELFSSVESHFYGVDGPGPKLIPEGIFKGYQKLTGCILDSKGVGRGKA